jgi:hypothetical protein
MTSDRLMHFVVTAVYYTWLPTGYQVDCYTNNPCHLYLRWTNVEPQHHVNAKIVRGAVAGTWIDQCFVVFHDIEQNQLGDTIRHTFIVDPWPKCEKRWFYFYGYVNGQLSPSCSPIFVNDRCVDHFPVNPEGTLLVWEPWTVAQLKANWTFFWTAPPGFDPYYYVSPPTSLQAYNLSGTLHEGTTILQDYTCIPEIRIINNVWFDWLGSEAHMDYFRMQAPPETPLYTPWNTYGLRFYPGRAYFYYTVNGASYEIAHHTFSPPLSLNKWYKYRFTLWDIPNHTNPTSIGYEFDLWENDAWKPYLQGTSTVNLWSHSLVNLYAFKLQSYGYYPPNSTKVDETQVLIPP